MSDTRWFMPDGNPVGHTRSAREQEVIQQLYDRKAQHQPIEAYCTVVEPIVMCHYDQVLALAKTIFPVGTTLRIVMVSRMGDCGLTNELERPGPYDIRIDWNSNVIGNIRWTRDPGGSE